MKTPSWDSVDADSTADYLDSGCILGEGARKGRRCRGSCPGWGIVKKKREDGISRNRSKQKTELETHAQLALTNAQNINNSCLAGTCSSPNTIRESRKSLCPKQLSVMTEASFFPH